MSGLRANHDLKTWPKPFSALLTGKKTFEYRKSDRNFEVGDILLLREWDPDVVIDPSVATFVDNVEVDKHYTGRQARFRVTYVARGGNFGIPEDHVVMSITPASWTLRMAWSFNQ